MTADWSERSARIRASQESSGVGWSPSKGWETARRVAMALDDSGGDVDVAYRLRRLRVAELDGEEAFYAAIRRIGGEALVERVRGEMGR